MTPGVVRSALIGAAIATTIALVQMRSTAQQPQRPTFSARVDLVSVDVAVERRGRPVAGLSEGDFEVLDNGVRQKLDRVTSQPIPLEAWLVLDVSGSLQGQPLMQLKQAASAFVTALAPGDRAGLVTFSHQVLVPERLTADLAAVRSAVTRMQAQGATALYDGTYVALQFRNPGQTRGVAVVLTDGADNASWLTAERVVEAAEHSDVVVYGIAVNDPAVVSRIRDMQRTLRQPPRPISELLQYRFLDRLAATSGGRLLDASFTTLREAFARVLDEIRARYLLTYYPSNPTPGWHALDVKLTRTRADVIARRGYWVAPP